MKPREEKAPSEPADDLSDDSWEDAQEAQNGQKA